LADHDDAMEESTDLPAVDAALIEGNQTIPWDQVKADLGWTRPTGSMSRLQRFVPWSPSIPRLPVASREPSS
jgi:hypothetical protein